MEQRRPPIDPDFFVDEQKHSVTNQSDRPATIHYITIQYQY